MIPLFEIDRSSSGVAKNNKLQKGALGQAFYNKVHAEMHNVHAEGTKPTTRLTVQHWIGPCYNK